MKQKTIETVGVKMWCTSFLVFSVVFIAVTLFTNNRIETIAELAGFAVFFTISTALFGLPGILVIDHIYLRACLGHIGNKWVFPLTFLAVAFIIIACMWLAFGLFIDEYLTGSFYVTALITSAITTSIHARHLASKKKAG
ncbi:MAG: hypothetical protein JNL72_07770 [Flavipsychrobacter sp.]|nr:hypothetical protein [Flavipsychrobacter sp.]